MKISLSVTPILLVVALTIAAASYRVYTAPERIRQRLDAARTTCLNSGGEWVKIGKDELCVSGAESKKG